MGPRSIAPIGAAARWAKRPNVLELCGELVTAAAAGASLADFRTLALRQMARVMPCDASTFADLGPRFSEDLAAPLRAIHENPDRYDPGFARARLIGARFGTAFLDTEAYDDAERDRLPVFVEVLRPAGVISTLHALVRCGDRVTGVLALMRGRGPRFEQAQLDAAQPLLQTIGLVHGALLGRAGVDLPELTPREQLVAALAAEGFQALQIAARLGRSTHTVRRQLESIYRKCAIGNRAELTLLVERRRAGGSRHPLRGLLGSVGLTGP